MSLPDCPWWRLGCVSSDAARRLQRVRPIPVPRGARPEAFWSRVTEAVDALPRTTIVFRDGTTLRAECRSRLGFVDDLELHHRPGAGIVAVRSAPRRGLWDGGVNRRRVARLRRALRE